MRIHGGWSGWYAVYALLLRVSAYPTKDRIDEMYVSDSSKSSDQETMASNYDFEGLSTSKLFKIIDDELEELEEEGLSTMRAITTKTRSNAILLPLIIEPEAEMLPPGYKGVKPPGVSHMELAAFERPQIRSLDRKSATIRASDAMDDDENPNKPGGFDRYGDAYYAASKHETQLAGDSAFETGLMDDSTNARSERAKYVESSDTRKSYSKNENRAKDREDGIVKKRDDIHGTWDRRKKTHNTGGYRDVYRKDELKKDSDFDDNGRQVGRFNKQHGRYGKRHAVDEHTYEKDKSNDSGLVEVETNKRRKFEKTRASREAQGQATADSSAT